MAENRTEIQNICVPSSYLSLTSYIILKKSVWTPVTHSVNWVKETRLLYKALWSCCQASPLWGTWDVTIILIIKEISCRSLLAWVEWMRAAPDNLNQPTRGADPSFLPSSSEVSSDCEGYSAKPWEWRETGWAMSLCDCKTRTTARNQVCFQTLVFTI